jgi:hypothetical protein
MKTLTLTDAQHALIVSILQGDILETEQMIHDHDAGVSMVSKEELQEYLAQVYQILKLADEA